MRPGFLSLVKCTSRLNLISPGSGRVDNWCLCNTRGATQESLGPHDSEALKEEEGFEERNPLDLLNIHVFWSCSLALQTLDS